MDRCHHQKETLMLYVYGELEIEARKSFANHLEVCESCRIEHRRLTNMLEKLKGIKDVPEPAPAELASMVHRIQSKLGSASRQRWWQHDLPSIPGRFIPALVAACLLVVVLGVIGYGKFRNAAEPTALAVHQEKQLGSVDLEMINNLDLLKEMDAIQKLVQVVDVKDNHKSLEEIQPDTRGMKPHVLHKVYA